MTGEASTGTIKKVVENLPKFMEQQAKLSVHTSIAAEINGGVVGGGGTLHSSVFSSSPLLERRTGFKDRHTMLNYNTNCLFQIYALFTFNSCAATRRSVATAGAVSIHTHTHQSYLRA